VFQPKKGKLVNCGIKGVTCGPRTPRSAAVSSACASRYWRAGWIRAPSRARLIAIPYLVNGFTDKAYSSGPCEYLQEPRLGARVRHRDHRRLNLTHGRVLTESGGQPHDKGVGRNEVESRG
jgi:hypothetical protein